MATASVQLWTDGWHCPSCQPGSAHPPSVYLLLAALQQLLQGIPVLVDDTAAEVTGVLTVSAQNTLPAHGLVTLLAEQLELLCGMGVAQERLPSLAAILAVLQFCHSMGGHFLPSPRQKQTQITYFMHAGYKIQKLRPLQMPICHRLQIIVCTAPSCLH